MVAKRSRVPVLSLLLLLGLPATAVRLLAEPAGCTALAPALTAAAQALPGPEAAGSAAFASYLSALQKQSGQPALAGLAAGRPVPADSAAAASCVLRGYVQARYGQRIVRDLQELVGFQTFVVEGRENWGAPEFLRQRDWLAARAKALGLSFKDYDGRMEEITLVGPAPTLALLTHGDVQGVEGQEWSSPPFAARQVGDRIVGRGTEDDKGPIVACLYTLAALKDSGWPLARTVRLLIANGEESSWDEIPYYLARAPIPEITVGIDAAYPVTYAQKGYGILTFRTGTPNAAASGGRWRVAKIAGGSGLSIIPERGEALVEPLGGGAAAARLGELAGLAKTWAAAHPPANLTVSPEGDLLKIVAVGHGGHSSAPASGHNALGDLAAFLSQLDLRHDAWGGRTSRRSTDRSSPACWRSGRTSPAPPASRSPSAAAPRRGSSPTASTSVPRSRWSPTAATAPTSS